MLCDKYDTVYHHTDFHILLQPIKKVSSKYLKIFVYNNLIPWCLKEQKEK